MSLSLTDSGSRLACFSVAGNDQAPGRHRAVTVGVPRFFDMHEHGFYADIRTP